MTASPTPTLWTATATPASRLPLGRDVSVEFCVIGAGIAGLTTAYHLAKDGRDVLVLDDGVIGGGESNRTTAHLSTALDNRYSRLRRIHGDRLTGLAAQSHAAAIDRIEKICAEEQIACQFSRKDGYLFLCDGDNEKTLHDELASAKAIGLAGLALVTRAPVNALDTGICLRFPAQAQFHIVPYLSGLAAAAEKVGANIHTGTHVSEVNGGEPCTVKTSSGYTITAKAVIVATNAPICDNAIIYGRQAAYRSYVIAARVPKSDMANVLLWDTADQFHYVRFHEVTEGDPFLIVGGEDDKTGQHNDAELHYANLQRWALSRFPQMQKIEHRWSGQVMETVDGLAFIGKHPGREKNLFIATGDCGNGITHGTIAGMLLSALVQGRDHPWEEVYAPSRVRIGSFGELTKEGVNVACEIAADILYRKKGDAPASMTPESGTVIKRDGKRIALYCDTAGALHERSAVCPHRGCIVRWNSGEKSWDCPCHGSRFDGKTGEVLNGPAISGLPVVS